MGHEILYCWKCRTRILGADFETGGAYQVGDRAACSACAAEFLTTLAPKDRERLLARMLKATQDRGAAQDRRPRTRAPEKRPGSRWLLVVGAGVAAFILAVGGTVLWSRAHPEAPTTPSRDVEARAALARAREAARDTQADFARVLALWQDAVWASEGSPLAKEARDEFLLVATNPARMEAHLASLARKEEFAKAFGFLAEARARRSDSDWHARVDRMKAELLDSSQKLYSGLLEKAVDAKGRGAAVEVKAIEERVHQWGLASFDEQLKKDLASVGSASGSRPVGDDGLVCVEAENYHRIVERPKFAWAKVNAPAGFLGTGAMATPDHHLQVDENYVEESPRLDYKINFRKPGTYTVWVRVFNGSGNDSVHVGLDGAAVPAAAHMTFHQSAGWIWSNATLQGGTATLEIRTAGEHTLNLWMREDGTIVDRLLLTLNPLYRPTGGGPPENSR